MKDYNRATVLLLGPALEAVSGVATHLKQLLRSDLADDFDLHHFQVGSEGRGERRRERALRLLTSPFVLARRIVILRPEIVHINTSLDHKAFWRDAAYLVLAKLLNRRVVYQVHGGAIERFVEGLKGLGFLLKWLLRRPDALVILAKAEERAYQSFGLRRDTRLIPNAIDLTAYHAAAQKRERSWPMRLVYAGRLAEDKGLFEAVEAIGLLRREGESRDIRFYIAGSGPAEGALREQVEALKLEDNVTFVGPLSGNALTQFWLDADLFLFPTFHQEGLPYAVLESLAAGTPVVTTRVGGIPDVVEDGIHGVFVAPRNPRMLAGVLKALLHDPDRVGWMAGKCIERAREFYGVERMTRQMRDVYNEVLGTGRIQTRKDKATDLGA